MALGKLLKGFRMLGGKIKPFVPKPVINSFNKGSFVNIPKGSLLEKLQKEESIIFNNKRFSKARLGNWAKNMISETANPVEAFKKILLDIKYVYDPKSGGMRHRSLAGKIGMGTMLFGPEALGAYSIANDDSYDGKSKALQIGGSVALGLGTRKMIPSMIGYQLLGKIAPQKAPKFEAPNLPDKHMTGGYYAEPANANPVS